MKAAGVTEVFGVRYGYGGGQQRHRPLRVQFDGDEPRPFGSGTVSITVYAVPSAERRSTMARLEGSLAAVCEWIRRAETAPPGWRMTRHDLTVELHDDQARVIESG